jgi:hypothetical protein
MWSLKWGLALTFLVTLVMGLIQWGTATSVQTSTLIPPGFSLVIVGAVGLITVLSSKK